MSDDAIPAVDQRAPRRGGAKGESAKRAAPRREAFIEAASELMNVEGVRGLTLANVAARVGMTTPSMFHYFANKNDLAAAALLQAMQRLCSVLDLALCEREPRAQLTAFLRLYLEMLRQIRVGEAPAIASLADVPTLVAQGRADVGEAYVALFRQVRALFGESACAWMERSQRNARAYLLLQMVLWTPAWIRGFEPEDFATIGGRLADVLLDGLAQNRDTAWSPEPIEGMPEAPPRVGRPLPRDTLVLAAIQLINEQGYRGASMERIAARLNVTKGAFYHQHGAKDDLVVECLARSQAIVGHAQTAAMGRPGTGLTRLGDSCAALVGFQLSPAGPLLLTGAIHALPEALARQMLEGLERSAARFALMVSEGIVDGSVRRVDAVAASHLVLAAITCASQLPLWTGTPYAGDGVDIGVRPLLYGIFSR